MNTPSDKPKCEDIGFEHNWKDATENIVYATMPPSYPPKRRECINCGSLEELRLKQREIKEWEALAPTNP